MDFLLTEDAGGQYFEDAGGQHFVCKKMRLAVGGARRLWFLFARKLG
jgi:hypothetical protein